MAERALPRLTRLLGIVSYLEDNGPTAFDELAEHFGVAPAQIARDVSTLSLTGVPGGMPDDLIDFDFDAYDQGIAALTRSQGVRQVRLSPREGIALVAALKALVGSGSAPAAAGTALAKVSAALGEDPVTVVPYGQLDDAVVRTMLGAVATHRVTRVEYVDAGDRRTDRVIEPHRIVTIDGAPYVECWCRRARDYRTLRLDRIVGAEVTDEAISAPPSDHEGFELAAAYEATVVLDRAARWIAEDLPGAELEDTDDAVVVRVGVAEEEWLAARLLTVAPLVRSVEPVALRDALVRQGRAVAAAHRE